MVRKTFATLAEAKAWRAEAQVKLRARKLNVPTKATLAEAADEWLEAARAGVIRTRAGETYKPSAIRSYDFALNKHLLPKLGRLRLSAVSRNRVQDVIDTMVRAGYSPSSIRNAVLPLRVIYRRAVDRDEISVNPTERLSLPSDRRRRERIARPGEAEALIDALAPQHQAVWATAFYAGLRRGELQALDWAAIDLDGGVIEVLRSWDPRAGLIEPKSRSGERTVPIPRILHRRLAAQRLLQGRGGQGFAFSITPRRPFDPPNSIRHAKHVWAQAGLTPIRFHECRHAYASFMIAAGVNAKALSTYMGHSSARVASVRSGVGIRQRQRSRALCVEARARTGVTGGTEFGVERAGSSPLLRSGSASSSASPGEAPFGVALSSWFRPSHPLTENARGQGTAPSTVLDTCR